MSKEIFAALAEPFAPDEVQWRPGSTTKDGKRALALAYIDARAVMKRLDTVVGPGNWQDEYQVVGTRVICRIGVRIDGEWVWKSDGAGGSQVEGEKGGISDAFKRAAVKWAIGRYIYDLPSPWVELDEHKCIKTLPPLPAWALPGGRKSQPAQQKNGTHGAENTGPPAAQTGSEAWTDGQKNAMAALKKNHAGLLSEAEHARIDAYLADGLTAEEAKKKIIALQGVIAERRKEAAAAKN